MVTLTRIYTRGGDQGQTSLGDGSRVAKHALRVEAYGTVDEANATLGPRPPAQLGRARRHAGARAERAVRPGRGPLPPGVGFRQPEAAAGDGRAGRAPRARDRRDERGLAPLSSFVLPGGSAASAHLHLARTVVRRAERLVTALAENEPVNPVAVRYLNRLSDHLFVLSRVLNSNGAGDVLWEPGATR